MTIDRPDVAAVVHTERIACVLRLAVGLLLLAMTLQFDPFASWLAVAGIVTALGWSALMAVALRSDLSDDHVRKLAGWSHWFDITLAVVVYVSFLPDPVATPVAGLPLLAYRLAVRYGKLGVVAGGLTFAAFIGGRIVFTRVTVGEGLVRPPLLLAWALVATVVLMLAAESRARSAAAETASRAPSPEPLGPSDTTGTTPAEAVSDAAPVVPTLPAASVTGDERLDSLVACLSLKLETAPPVRLTERELEVLLLLGQGHSYGRIAATLFISQSTVRNHVHNIRAKLDVQDREELLRLARALADRVETTEGNPEDLPDELAQA